MKGALAIAVGIAVGGMAIAMAIYATNNDSNPAIPEVAVESSMSPSPSASPRYVLTGTVVFDGVTEGCSGEEMLVSIRASGHPVASNIARSMFRGFDCVVPIELPVPRLKCYELYLDKQPVGYYHFLDLKAFGFNVGYISSDSVYGNVYNDYDPRSFADRGFPC